MRSVLALRAAVFKRESHTTTGLVHGVATGTPLSTHTHTNIYTHSHNRIQEPSQVPRGGNMP